MLVVLSILSLAQAGDLHQQRLLQVSTKILEARLLADEMGLEGTEKALWKTFDVFTKEYNERRGKKEAEGLEPEETFGLQGMQEAADE